MNKSVYVTDATFESDVLESDIPVLVDFYSDWCGPCRAIHYALDDIAQVVYGEFAVVALNTDENSATAYLYGVSDIPTLILFKDGRPVERFSGIVPKQTISRSRSQSPRKAALVQMLGLLIRFCARHEDWSWVERTPHTFGP